MTTARLLRSPDLQEAPEKWPEGGSFAYFPLGQDVFLWLTDSHNRAVLSSEVTRFFWLVGLYAHPQGRQAEWVKTTGVLIGEFLEAAPDRPWQKIPRPEPRVEDARKELEAFVQRSTPPKG